MEFLRPEWAGPRAIPFQPPQGDLAVLAGSANPLLTQAIANDLGVHRSPLAGRMSSAKATSSSACWRTSAAATFRHPGRALPGQRQLHGAAVLDRRPQAGQRPAGDGGHSVFQLRQGRQERRAPRVDPGPRLCRRHRSRRGRPRADDGPAQPADPGLLPDPGRSSVRHATSSVDHFKQLEIPDWSSAAPTSGSPRSRGFAQPAWQCRSSSATSIGPITREGARCSKSSATSRTRTS